MAKLENNEQQLTALEKYELAKECFEKAIRINPTKPEGYVLLAQTLQLMSGYDNPEHKLDAEENYKKAMEIFQNENLLDKVEDMKRQIKHLNSKSLKEKLAEFKKTKKTIIKQVVLL